MSRSVQLAESAIIELVEASMWYEERRTGLGSEFRHAVVEVIDRLWQHVDSGPRIAQVDAFRVRRCLVRKFPFQVVFYLQVEVVVVVAIAHTSRRPGYWKRRLPPDPA